MSVSRYKLGDLIEICDDRNESGYLSLDDVRGISTDKLFIATKANMDGVNLDSYKVVDKNVFAYVPDTSRRGDKIAIAFNTEDKPLLVSSIYTTFYCKNTELIYPEYLFMFFNRPEFDRYARFNSWGSARETFSWEDFCDTPIDLPSLDVQKHFASLYVAYSKCSFGIHSKELCPILIKGSLQTEL